MTIYDLSVLEESLKKNDLSFEEQIEIRDKILEAKSKLGEKRPVYQQINCIGCSG